MNECEWVTWILPIAGAVMFIWFIGALSWQSRPQYPEDLWASMDEKDRKEYLEARERRRRYTKLAENRAKLKEIRNRRGR